MFAPMTDACTLCCYDYNKSTRLPTKCPYCEFTLCRTCLQTYIENDISDVPRCPQPACAQGWERDFLDKEMTRTFRLVTYKAHREKTLCDREKSRLPSTQEDAAAYREANTIYKATAAEMTSIHAQIAALTRSLHEQERIHYRASQTVDSYGRRRMPAATAATAATAAGTVAEGAVAVAVADRIEHVRASPATFIKPCPAPDCKGFLSTAWKCGLCAGWSCPDCHDFKGPEKNVEHTCDPGKVATAALLAKEAKSCPKCGVSICKIEGCDQMFCTACNTGFSWRTGKIAEGPVHNPHYFAWLRSQGRDPTAAPPPAALTCDQTLDRSVAQALDIREGYNYGYHSRHRRPQVGDENTVWLAEAWRVMREFQDTGEYGRQEPDIAEQYRILRVKYMTSVITEEEWKAALQRYEKDARFQRAKNNVREVFVNACRDLIRQVVTADADKAGIRRQVEELITYCNTSYGEVTKTFGRKTPTIKVELRPQ